MCGVAVTVGDAVSVAGDGSEKTETTHWSGLIFYECYVEKKQR